MSPSLPSLPDQQKNILVESIFNQVHEGILVTDRKGVIQLANPAVASQFGYSIDELQGKPVEVLVPEASRSRHREMREGYMDHPVERPMGGGRDLYGRKKNGEVIPIEISLTPFESAGRMFIVVYIVDNSLRKQNENTILEKQKALEKAAADLKANNEQLEKKVQDRTQVLREALHALEKSKVELSHALEKERELNELKSRFISMASHEFRTPLTAILSSASLIAEYADGGQQDKRMKHVDRIKVAVSNLTDILSDFLSLSRIEEGKIQVTYSAFSFHELLDEVCNELKAISKPGQRLDCSYSGEDEVVLDRKLVRQVLANLLSNAIKYSDEGKDVTLRAEQAEGMLRIEIRDRGIGISQHDQDHLFERFFRGKNATNIQGTGLGLNIVSNYVELLDGIITFESELNVGSTFRVTLPVKTKNHATHTHPAD